MNHRELAVPRHEVARAVERVDEPRGGLPPEARIARRVALLRDDGHAGTRARELRADQRVRFPIGARHRIVLCLELDLERTRVDASDSLGRLPRDPERDVERPCAVNLQVRIPTFERALGSADRSSSARYRGPDPVSLTSCSSCSTDFGPSTALDTR